ncbi:DUF59 domain-containing protein [Methanophagales archaeon]|nr:MAG: DUF59 domain-containing protein [Methanophagales archaeon]
MAKEKSEEDIRQVVADIKHPAIDRTLVDLGIVKEIAVKGNKVLVTMALPFPNKEDGCGGRVELTIMNQEELQAFLAMEQESWKRGM